MQMPTRRWKKIRGEKERKKAKNPFKILKQKLFLMLLLKKLTIRKKTFQEQKVRAESLRKEL